MVWVNLVTLCALIEYFVFSALVGKARVRYGLDYLASSHGVEPGDIYSAGPGDPPPTAPPT